MNAAWLLPTSTLLNSLLTRGTRALRCWVVLQRHLGILHIGFGLGIETSFLDLVLVELDGVRPQDARFLSSRSVSESNVSKVVQVGAVATEEVSGVVADGLPAAWLPDDYRLISN